MRSICQLNVVNELRHLSSYLSSSPLASGLSLESLKMSNLLVSIRETSILLASDPGSADEDSPGGQVEHFNIH